MAPKRQPAESKAIKDTTLLIDNGAFNIKAGFVTSTPSWDDCQLIPNCIARDRDKHVFIGPQLDAAKDFGEMAFRRPIEKGFVVNWEGEKAIWNQSFFAQNAPLQVRRRQSCQPKFQNEHVGLTLPETVRSEKHEPDPHRGAELPAGAASQLRPNRLRGVRVRVLLQMHRSVSPAPAASIAPGCI